LSCPDLGCESLPGFGPLAANNVDLTANLRWLAGYRHRRHYLPDVREVLRRVLVTPTPLMAVHPRRPDSQALHHAPETAGRLYLSLNGLATDLDTEHGGTDANKRDGARQLGRLNVDDLQL
jgi:hypothetical protein